VTHIRATRQDLEARRSAGSSKAQEIDHVERELTVEAELVQTKSVNQPASLVYPIMLDAQYADLANVVESSDSAPPAQTYEMFQTYEKKREQQFARWKALQTEISKIQN
jgi:hypothetical protein